MIDEKDIKNKNDKKSMMFCSECGAKIRRGAKYCEECGSRMNYIEGIQTSNPQNVNMTKKQSDFGDINQMFNNNPFENTYSNYFNSPDMYKRIGAIFCFLVLSLLWICAPIIHIDFVGAYEMINQVDFVDEFIDKDMTFPNTVELMGAIITSDNAEFLEEMNIATLVIFVIFLTMFIWGIFIILLINSLIKNYMTDIKEDGRSFNICSFVLLAFLLIFISVLNDCFSTEYYDFVDFKLGIGGYLIIVITIAFQCLLLTIPGFEEKNKKIEDNKLEDKLESWICPTCGTENPGNQFCYKCGFDSYI